ncbi:hypothetical protein BD311DRAFT_663831 [Dichomitus squalens]|uniref:DUF4218 domain-containing protein n=1 Tax=Dichomitus squalens TaxID=114155 RepID=A0A4Q9ML07_9APHY|nr:hypothetical protein BD311DRAFT_663831 [Dichomitus squalens]
MHNLFLGELRHHCMEVWGIDVKDKIGQRKATPHSPEEQQKWLTRLVADLRNHRPLSSIEKPRKGYLVAVAQLNGIVPQSKLTKREYAKALIDWVKNHPVDMLRIPPVLSKETDDFHLAANEHDISKFRVLTPEVINQLRHDLQNTYLPSWLERPPVNFGSASHGKLKADHWRTVCTINMVITLVRIWSSPTATTGDRLLLENFIHLVTAVDMATRRSMDTERARQYDFQMLQYLRTLRSLFEHDLVPNHHLSLHLVTCLLLFGPVHGWWAYPFERFNGMIQRLNMNHRISEIPLTFMRTFYAGAEVRWMTQSTDWPDSPEFRMFLDAFNNTFRDTAHGSWGSVIASAIHEWNCSTPDRFVEIFEDLDTTRLQQNLYTTFLHLVVRIHAPLDIFTSYDSDLVDDRSRLSPLIRCLPKLEEGRVVYGTRDKNIRNSYICFRDPLSGNPSLVRAGQISQLFLHSRIIPGRERVVEPFAVVDEYVPLSDYHAEHDPYRRYPLIDTQLYYNYFLERQAVIRCSDIISHFAAFVTLKY